MTLIQSHPEARWLPSRSHFALFRLAAYVRLRLASHAADADHVRRAFAIDEYQNAVENYSVAAAVLVLTICYTAAALSRWMHEAVAFGVAVALAPVVVELPFYTSGLLIVPLWNRLRRRTGENNVSPNSFFTMACLLAANTWFALEPGAMGTVARLVFGVFVANVMAALVMWFLRGSVRELEARCGD